MNRRFFSLAGLLPALGLAVAARAEIQVRTEQVNPGSPAWAFQKIPGPSKSDAAQHCPVVAVGNSFDPVGSDAAALTDGRMPAKANQPRGFTFFANENTNGGRMLLDLGKVLPIAAINTYSWHDHPPDGGARGPQVYALYASAAEKPDAANLAAPDWKKIADVDTRPNQSGGDWGGQHGVSIRDTAGLIGHYRWLVWAAERTGSPRTKAGYAATFFCELDVHTPDTLARAGDAEVAVSKVKEVVIVFKTHFDIGYTDMASNVVKRYQTTMIDQALKVVDQNRDLPPEQQFIWTIPGWPMAKITEDWPGQTPERKQRVMAAFKEGRFAVHALPFSTHTELLEPEDLVRGLGYASRLSRAVGLELPRDAKMTDVPCHSWIMPTLLRNAGVDFLHLGCNAASSSPQVPELFFWEGPDGSRLLTMYSAAGYGTGLTAPEFWPYQTWLALIHTGDNHGPPTPDEVKKLLEDAKARLPGVKVRIGRLSDFADAILAEKAEIPVVRGDMPDTWIHGPMSDPQGAKLARNTRPAIATAEALNTMLGAWGVPVPDISDTVAKAYEQSLLYGEHTWGGAQYWVTKYGAGTKWSYGDGWKADEAKGRFQRLEDSWAEHTAYIEKARDLVEPLLQSQMKALAEAVAQDGERIVVFNPLPWKRLHGVGKTDLNGTSFGKEATQWLILPGDNIDQGNCTCVSDGKELRFGTESLECPPLGYRTFTPGWLPVETIMYYPQTFPAQARVAAGGKDATFEVARGAIRSSREIPIDRTSPFGFGQILYERFDASNVAAYVKSYVKIQADWAVNELGKPAMPPASAVPYRAASPTNFTVRYTNSWFAGEAIMEAPASEQVPFAVTTRYVFYNWQPFFDIEVTVHNKPADPWPEAAWICLPFNVDSPQFRLGRQGSIVDPAKDLIPGANHNLYAIDTGVAVFDANGRGVGVCPLDSPLVSLDEPGCWKYSRDFVPKKPVLFINLFNNQWTTNFRMWNHGTWTSRVRIWSFGSFDAERNLIRPSLEARYPLQAVCVSGKGGKLPLSQSGLELPRRGTLVTAFGPNPDGPGTLLRLWELAGQSGPCLVRLPDGLKTQSVQPVDLRGRPSGAALPVKDHSFQTPLRAFAPASFVLER